MKRILLVEDEKPLAENISLLLSGEGYEVIYAQNGLEALKISEDVIPDLILSDIMMPYIDGYELFQRIKKNNKTKFLPFLFLTAKSDLASIREGMGLGADDYIIKPFSSDDLLHTIKIRLAKNDLINAQIDEIRDSISKYVPHEFRTPLVAILGYSQLVLNEHNQMDKNEIVEMVDRINIGAKRLHKRIEKFLQLIDLEPVNRDIWFGENHQTILDNNTANEIVRSHYFIKDRKDDIKIKIAPAYIKIPERYLYSIINELLENAVKFSESGKPILITGKKVNRYYQLIIKDEGMGMDEIMINQIGAFKQFNREVIQKEGNGLGLIFVKKVVQIIKGKLIIKSLENKFTEITLKLPLAQ